MANKSATKAAWGFSVDSVTLKLVIKDIAYFTYNQGVPTSVDGISVGVDSGQPYAKTSKVMVTIGNKLLYRDLQNAAYTGKTTEWGQLKHDDQGFLLVDSVGKIDHYWKGMAMTMNDIPCLYVEKSGEKPSKTTLISAEAESATKINIEFSEPTTGTKPFDFVAKVIGGGKTIEVNPQAVAVKGSYFGSIEGLTKGTQYSVQIYTKNAYGIGEISNAIAVTTPSTVEVEPLIGGQSFDDGIYKYCVFYSNATTGYQAFRTKDGESTEFEVLMVGAGGAGKGQTVTLAKGGDGGGGQLVIGKLPPRYSGDIFITVPNGGTSSNPSPENVTVKEYDTVLTAISGKSATDKNDGAGYPLQPVPESWWKLRQFSWYEPQSHSVGGVAQSGEQNYPSAMFAGEGGAGTKTNTAGKGGESYVAIRWKK